MATIALTLLTLGLLTTGIVLVVVGRSAGRPYPSCGRCGYDVSGSIGSVARCPECGIPFAQAGIVAPRGRRSRVVFASGVLLTLLTVGAGVSAILVTRVIAVNANAMRAAQQQAIQAKMAQQRAREMAEASAALAEAAQAQDEESGSVDTEPATDGESETP